MGRIAGNAGVRKSCGKAPRKSLKSVAVRKKPPSADKTAEVKKSSAKDKAVKPKAEEPKAKPNHPKTSEMVIAAITNLDVRRGSSLQSIKKYIAGTYVLDVEKLAPHIKKYVTSAVASGELIQTTGKGASGSFKLPPKTKRPKVSKEEKPESESAVKEPPKKAKTEEKPKSQPKAKKVAAAAKEKAVKPKKRKATAKK